MPAVEIRLYKMEHEADPFRCISNLQTGQCVYLSMEGMVARGYLEDPTYRYNGVKNCPRHAGEVKARQNELQRINDYRIRTWQSRIDEFSNGEGVKSLRGEIGIVRMMIEEILSQANDTQQLMMYSSRVQKLVQTCESLVRTCDKLEDKMGLMMDKTSALTFAGQIVRIIGNHVQDAGTVEIIADEIIALLGQSDGTMPTS